MDYWILHSLSLANVLAQLQVLMANFLCKGVMVVVFIKTSSRSSCHCVVWSSLSIQFYRRIYTGEEHVPSMPHKCEKGA